MAVFLECMDPIKPTTVADEDEEGIRSATKEQQADPTPTITDASTSNATSMGTTFPQPAKKRNFNFLRRHSAPVTGTVRASSSVVDDDDNSSVQSCSTLAADDDDRHPLCNDEITAKAGWLLKQTTRKKFNGHLAYHKRYFILDRALPSSTTGEGSEVGSVAAAAGKGSTVVASRSKHARLSWYDGLRSIHANDTVIVGADCVVRSLAVLDKPRSKKYHLELTVPGKRVYVLRANDPIVRDGWVTAIGAVVKEEKEKIRAGKMMDQGTGTSPPTSPFMPIEADDGIPRQHQVTTTTATATTTFAATMTVDVTSPPRILPSNHLVAIQTLYYHLHHDHHSGRCHQHGKTTYTSIPRLILLVLLVPLLVQIILEMTAYTS